MSLSTILALLDDKHAAATLRCAGFASAAIGAPVDAVYIKPDPRDSIPLIGEGMSGELVQQIMDSAEAAGDQAAALAKRIFDAWEAPNGAEFVEVVGGVADVVTRAGRAHGMTVLPCGAPGDGGSEAIDAALFESGRPTLIAPLHEVDSVGKRIAIFWKDSAEAAKAVWGAVPFLRQAEQVTAFCVGEDFDADASLQRILNGLERAGVEADGVAMAPNRDSVATQLADAASDMNADMAVMGAFTHSRLRELVLGGVTQDVLDGLARPVFMAH